MKIWIDLANAPHVSFFIPIIRNLQAARHEVLITMRRFNNTVEIAAEHGITGHVVGRHGGKSDFAKVLNLAIRSIQLARIALYWRPHLSISHNSYTHSVAGRLTGSRVVTIMDYEGQPANHIAFRMAHHVIVPDCFPESALRRFGAIESKVHRYSGFKEQLYLSNYSPNKEFPRTFRQACGLPDSWDLNKNVLVIVRTPATLAAYHHFRNILFGELLSMLNKRTDLTTVVFTRNHEEENSIRRNFPDLIIPVRPMIGADLVYYSDVVISAGGTMNREAAILGTPAYTIFAGELPAVDRRLVELGRLRKIVSVEDLSQIRFEKCFEKKPLNNPNLCNEIVDWILFSSGKSNTCVTATKLCNSRPDRLRGINLIRAYYLIKAMIPRQVQLGIRRVVARHKVLKHAHHWPIDKAAGHRPNYFPGWPKGKRFALVLRHDVESRRGLNQVADLAILEQGFGVRSAYFFVPGAYTVPKNLLEDLRAGGNEIGVHGWKHDGKLYFSRSVFLNCAAKINRTLDEWQAVGFASPSAHHHFEWLHDLKIDYDTSSFDTDPFEPQPDGLRSIFPLLINGPDNPFVELPYTLPQDFTLYVILREKNTKIWKEKIDWIVEKGGMVLLNTHPDYMSWKARDIGKEEYPVERYTSFLKYVLSKYEGKYWLALPREVASFWRSLSG